MSLAPSTDLVLEVSRAADPARAAAVTEKLNALARQGSASPQAFASALDAAAPAASVAARPVSALSRGDKAERQLESVFLSQFVTEMLPKDAPSAFGQGYAGDMWRSMLAERVADQLAASGRLGLASRLFAHHPLGASQTTAGEARAEQTSANALSSPSGAEIAHGAALFAQAKPL